MPSTLYLVIEGDGQIWMGTTWVLPNSASCSRVSRLHRLLPPLYSGGPSPPIIKLATPPFHLGAVYANQDWGVSLEAGN